MTAMKHGGFAWKRLQLSTNSAMQQNTAMTSGSDFGKSGAGAAHGMRRSFEHGFLGGIPWYSPIFGPKERFLKNGHPRIIPKLGFFYGETNAFGVQNSRKHPNRSKKLLDSQHLANGTTTRIQEHNTDSVWTQAQEMEWPKFYGSWSRSYFSQHIWRSDRIGDATNKLIP